MSDTHGPLAHTPGEHAPEPHAGMDVSHLPSVEFGDKSLMWWGTFGFILIEGITLVIMAASYFYVRLNFQEWPPENISDPDVIVPTISTLLMLAVIWPMHVAEKHAKEFRRTPVATWLTIAGTMTLGATVLRAFEFNSLDVRWDDNAYGSVVWGLLILHTTLLLADLLETAVLAVMFWMGKAQKKHYSDVSDAALYQYFLSAVAVPVYLIIFWGPRFL